MHSIVETAVIWFCVPVLAVVLHRQFGAAADRLVVWLAGACSIAITGLALITYQSVDKASLPPDVYDKAINVDHIIILAMTYGLAALTAIMNGRYFPYRPRALSLILFAVLHAGILMSTEALNLWQWFVPPGHAWRNLPYFSWAGQVAGDSAMISLMLMVMATPVSIYTAYRKRGMSTHAL